MLSLRISTSSDLPGQAMKLSVKDKIVMIDNAKVTKADILGKKGRTSLDIGRASYNNSEINCSSKEVGQDESQERNGRLSDVGARSLRHNPIGIRETF
jgi:hypothetical protein